jgi:hypothetical protein
MSPFPNSPFDRYERDPSFRHLVDAIEMLLHEAKFTPTEVREAGIVACVRFEERIFRHKHIIPLREMV